MNCEESMAERSLMVFPAGPETREKAALWLSEKLDSVMPGANFPGDLIAETSLACYEYGTLRCVAVLYLDWGGRIAVCGWLIANPANQPHESERAVRAVLKAMPGYARRQGATFLLTTFGNRGINHILADLGFTPGDSSVQHFLKKLD